MAIERVVLASYAPDADSNNVALIEESNNIYPTSRGFKNLPDPATNVFPAVDSSANVSEGSPAHGAFMGDYYNGSTRIFAVTSTTTQRSGNAGRILEGGKSTTNVYTGTWSDVSPTDGTTYKEIAIPLNGRGQFAVFGDKTLYVDGASGYYVYDTDKFKRVEFETTSKVGQLATDPDTVSANHAFMPAPKYVVSTGEHVILLNFASGASNMGIALDQTSWWCSNSGSHLNFQDNKVTSTYSNASYLRDTPGAIVGAKTFGRDVIVYKQRSMHKLQWTGEQNVVFRNVVLSEKAGALSNEAVVNLGDRQVFFGYDDFYETSGSAPRTINNGLREFIFGTDGDLDQQFSFAVQSFYDRSRNTVFWFYPITGDTQREFNENDPILCRGVIAWNIATDKWAHGTSGLGGRPVTCVVTPEITPADSLGLSYKDFGSQTQYSSGGSSALTWGTNFQLSNSSIAYNNETIVGASEYSVGAFVASSTNTSAGLFSSGITAYTSSTYGGQTTATFQVNAANIRTGSFGDGNSHTFIRAVRPRFVGDKAPSQASIKVYSKADLTIPVEPKGQQEEGMYSAAVAQGTLSEFSSDLNVYDTAGDPTTTSLTTDPRAPQWFPVRATGRYIQFSFTFKGEAELMGFDIDYDTTGTR